MASGIQSFTNLMSDQEVVFGNLKNLLKSLVAAAKEKDGARISSLTSELLVLEQRAEELDREMVAKVVDAARDRGVDPRDFKLSMIDTEGVYSEKIDSLRTLISDVAALSAQVGGILAANVDVIEQTIKVLESIDARGGGYGPEKAFRGPAKLIDRSA